MHNIDFYISQVNSKKNVSQPSTSPCYHFGDVVLLKYTSSLGDPRPSAEEVAEAIFQKKAKGVRTPAHLAIKREQADGKNVCWVLQEAAKGKLKEEQYSPDVLQAPDSHYEQLIRDVGELRDMGMELKPKNIFYDPDPKQGGFTIIDLLKPSHKSFGDSFPEVYWAFYEARTAVRSHLFSDTENLEATRRCFLAMGKAIPNFSKHRRTLLRTLDEETITYFSQHGIEVGDLTLTPIEMKQFRTTERKMLSSCLDDVCSGKLKYWQIGANELGHRSKDGGLTDSWRYNCLNPLRPDDCETNWEYSSVCEFMRRAYQQRLFDKMLSETPDNGNQYIISAKADMMNQRYNPYFRDQEDLSIIFLAFAEHSPKGLELLKERPDLINKTLTFRETGMSPIFMAMRTNNEEAITYLLKNGANLISKDARNRTVLDYLPDVSSEQIRKDISLGYAVQTRQLENRAENVK